MPGRARALGPHGRSPRRRARTGWAPGAAPRSCARSRPSRRRPPRSPRPQPRSRRHQRRRRPRCRRRCPSPAVEPWHTPHPRATSSGVTPPYGADDTRSLRQVHLAGRISRCCVTVRLDGQTKQAGGAVAGLGLALLGPPVITWDGRPVSFDTKKATAVLALLAVEGRELSRERLAALLWPETDTSRARASLRRTLSG